MPKFLVLKPWNYSLHGFDSNTAAKGATLELPEELGLDGTITGHLEEVIEKKMRKGAPENKSEK